MSLRRDMPRTACELWVTRNTSQLERNVMLPRWGEEDARALGALVAWRPPGRSTGLFSRSGCPIAGPSVLFRPYGTRRNRQSLRNTRGQPAVSAFPDGDARCGNP